MVGDVIRVFIEAQRIHDGLSCFAGGAFPKHGQHNTGAVGRNGQVAIARLQSFEEAESELGAGEYGSLSGGLTLGPLGCLFKQSRENGRHTDLSDDYTSST